MNAGEKLVALSGLPSGSAKAHLLAITQGTGPGVDRLVFASQMAVCIESPRITLIQRPPEIEVSAKRAETTTTQQGRPNRLAILTRPSRLDIVTHPASLFVVQRSIPSVRVSIKPNTLTTRRKRTVKTI